MMNATHFKFDGRDVEATPYHYKECGLDNIYLVNGFFIEEFDGEKCVSVENIDELWKAICLSLITNPRALASKEVRFLRHHIDFTQAELAQRLRVDAQTVARWEKGTYDITGPADIALRFMVLAAPVMQPQGSRILAKLTEFTEALTGRDEDGPECVAFVQSDEGWQPARAA